MRKVALACQVAISPLGLQRVEIVVDPDNSAPRRGAIRFLKEQLATGGKLRGDLDMDARGEGINPASLNRAKARLHIKPRKTGLIGGWLWEFPEDAQPKAEDAQF